MSTLSSACAVALPSSGSESSNHGGAMHTSTQGHEMSDHVCGSTGVMRSRTLDRDDGARRFSFASRRRAAAITVAAMTAFAACVGGMHQRLNFVTTRSSSTSTAAQRFWEAAPLPLATGLRQSSAGLPAAAKAGARQSRSSAVLRRVKIDGKYGVLPEMPSPMIDTTEEKDPIWDRIIMAIQSADQKRGADMSAFWIHQGYDVVLIITALSRPQLQAIANNIEVNMRKKLRMKIKKTVRVHEYDIRNEAAAGWVCLTYPRLTVHVMTPVQRSYYDIEGVWRDENQDYEPIDIDVMLKEDSFGNLRLKQDNIADDEDEDEYDDDDELPGIGGTEAAPAGFYEEDETDPFWS